MAINLLDYSFYRDQNPKLQTREIPITVRELQALYDRIEKLEDSLKYVEDMLDVEIKKRESCSD